MVEVVPLEVIAFVYIVLLVITTISVWVGSTAASFRGHDLWMAFFTSFIFIVALSLLSMISTGVALLSSPFVMLALIMAHYGEGLKKGLLACVIIYVLLFIMYYVADMVYGGLFDHAVGMIFSGDALL